MTIKLRANTLYDFQQLAGKLIQGIDQKGAVISCLNCHKFNEATEMCGLFNARPPARVIAYGCERHDDIDEIPF